MKVMILLSLFSLNAFALEADYQATWCKANNGIWKGPSVTIRDPYTGKVEGYIDCLTQSHAFEVDFDTKWQESLTQALWYAMNTGKRAGILLIVSPNGTGEKKLRDTIKHYGLPVDVITTPK